MAASEEVREMIRCCLRALDFFAAYPMRGPKGPEDVPCLEMGRDERLVLYPFIIFGARRGSLGEEMFFVDAWDTKKGVARMKGFESRDTLIVPEISDVLGNWKDVRVGQEDVGDS